VLVLAAWLFLNVASLPLTEGLSPVQDAVPGNDIGVVPIIVSVALYIRRRGWLLIQASAKAGQAAYAGYIAAGVGCATSGSSARPRRRAGGWAW
jgi:hypothetical protein